MHYSIVVVLIIVLSVQKSVHGDKTIIDLAVFVPQTGRRTMGKTISPAAQLAVDDINSSNRLLPHHQLRISLFDTRCEEGKALVEMVRILVESEKIMNGIIGGGCDVVCTPLGLLASEFEIPIVSWGCTALSLSNKKHYSTFSRTVGTEADAFHAVMGVLRHFHWNRVGILVSVSGTWQWLAHKIKTQLQVNLLLNLKSSLIHL